MWDQFSPMVMTIIGLRFLDILFFGIFEEGKPRILQLRSEVGCTRDAACSSAELFNFQSERWRAATSGKSYLCIFQWNCKK